ncbi:uncharacterized protein LOC124543841 [Vanessa cardui]|uniref:uncharacterized protein LOC124543841 n=1 Tax=Vanessa cardui TaxID=171605 RepID=UPI001F128CAD|nr:uncharacterized protein LOC124543841 [Vanessa cardui]
MRVPVVRLERLGELSDADSASSRMSMASAVSKRSRKRAREVPDSGSDSARSDTPTRKGRPTTTGKYAGIGLSRREAAAATKAAAAAEKLEEDERQIAALTKRVVEGRATPRSESSDSAALEVEAEELPASDLNRRMTDAVAAIKRVGKVSKGLSGCSQKALKEATASILECAQVLLTRTDTEETALLRAQNTRLAAQVEALRKEQLELKAEMANFRREHLRREVGLLSATPDATLQPQQQQQSPQETELVRLIRQEMASFNARFSVLEGRILRPPLAADQRSAPAPTYAAKAAAPRATQPAQAAAAKKGKSKAAKKASAAKAAAPRTVQPAQTANSEKRPVSRPEAEWEVAGAAKRNKKARQRAKKEAQKKKEEGVAAAKRRPARLRTPRSTAVALTLQPGAEERGLSYADILAKAKAEISLSDLGITGLRCKTTATGGRLLEVSGATSGPKADALAEKLRASLGSDVRVSRPTKCAVLRISGLDDSATIEEVVAAVSKTGGCPPDQVKAGTIRRGFSGLGTTHVSCPLAAAKKLRDSRLLVGWVSAQVTLLPPRPFRCYRCLEGGHAGARCTTEVDRSQLCYRCGQPGHKAGTCSAKTPHCVICAASGKPADHKIGSKACTRPTAKTSAKKQPAHPPKTAARQKKKAASSSQPVRPPAAAQEQPRTGEEVTAMDTQ